ncbi:putative ABC transport system substrate-binding protein [Candidatus Kryptobacter tengchongensis]|nr:putative ABC transport system substrate-binding protein [Candidatus Kryptobacter tengchongensis]
MKRIILFLIFFQSMVFAQRATPLQYLYMMKSLKPEVQKIGVLCDLGKYQGLIEKLQRSAYSVGVKIIVADVKELKDVSQRFGDLVKNGVDFIWIFDESDVSAHPIAREFIIKNAILSKIPVAVPNAEFVKEGGLFSLEISGDDVKVYVNNKVANALQITVPENYKERVQYVVN